MKKKKYSILKSKINKEKTIFEIEELIKRIKKEEISFEDFNDSIKDVTFSNDCSLEEFSKKIFVSEFEIQSKNKESELMKTFEKENSLGIYSLSKILFSYEFQYLYNQKECEKMLESFAHHKGRDWENFQFTINQERISEYSEFDPDNPNDLFYHMILESMENLIGKLFNQIESNKNKCTFKELENIYKTIKINFNRKF